MIAQNGNILNMINESSVSSVLANFDMEYIFSIIRDNNMRKLNHYHQSLPNMVNVLETQYKSIMQFNNSPEVVNSRTEIYNKILKFLCDNYKLQLNPTTSEYIDIYPIVYMLYDLLIANFKMHIINFYTTFIYKERNDIYNQLDMNGMKKSKDSSTIYGKKLYSNVKLAVINANLEIVIGYINQLDITPAQILGVIYADKNMERTLCDNVLFSGTFFNDLFVQWFKNEYTKNALLTDIRLAIHRLACTTE